MLDPRFKVSLMSAVTLSVAALSPLTFPSIGFAQSAETNTHMRDAQEPPPASPQSAGQVNELGESLSPEGAAAAFSFSASATHYYGFRKEVDPFTVFKIRASKKAGAYRLGVSQTFTKNYFVYGGDAEVQAADTILSVGRAFGEPYYGFDLSTNLSLTLPISEFSRRQDIYTKPRADLIAHRSFFDKRLDYTLGLSLQYNINGYTTTVTRRGAGGGHPLRMLTSSIDNTLGYHLLPKLIAEGTVSYVKIRYHDIGYRNRQTTATGDALLNTNYSIDLSLNYEVWEHLTLSGGYSQSDLVEKTGGVSEAYIFDVYTTQWYVGLSSSF